jgi:hypothetical protein
LENNTITTMPLFDFTTRTNRTNRLEILEEYYNNVTANSTNEDKPEEITILEIKPIVLLSTNISISEESDRSNVTSIEQIGKICSRYISELRMGLCV